jgi:AraC family transcriptional regulator
MEGRSMGEVLDIVSMGQGDGRLADGLVVHRSSSLKPIVTSRHAHDFHQVMLFLSSPGHVDWRLGEGWAYSGRPAAGDVVVTPALVPILVRFEQPFKAVSVRLSTSLLDQVAGRSGLTAARLRPAATRHDSFAGEIARKLADEAESVGGGRALLAESLGAALAVHLLREYAHDVPFSSPSPRPNGLTDDDLRRVTDHIEGHLDGDLSLDRLAALAGLSPHHFVRRFRAAVGTTPHQYVIRRRVERARQLLLGGCDIAQAAARVGFSGQSHLHHHVRRLLGVTPGELVRSNGRNSLRRSGD